MISPKPSFALEAHHELLRSGTFPTALYPNPLLVIGVGGRRNLYYKRTFKFLLEVFDDCKEYSGEFWWLNFEFFTGHLP